MRIDMEEWHIRDGKYPRVGSWGALQLPRVQSTIRLINLVSFASGSIDMLEVYTRP